MSKYFAWTIFIVLLTIFFSGCGTSSTANFTLVPSISSTLSPSPTSHPSNTSSPTYTPSLLPSQTATIEPTVLATATRVPPPQGSSPGEAWIRPIDGMPMLYIPADEIEIGSSQADIDAALQQCEVDRGAGSCERAWFEDEAPRHTVIMKAYWIDQTEVTNAQFAAFLNDVGNQSVDSVPWLDLEDENSLIEQMNGNYRPKTGYADHPVGEVSWYGAKEYCIWAGGWLPTEAKWEYAARGPEGHTYPWGDDPPTCELANYIDCQKSTLPVGSLPDGVSWIGAFDMAGNVWEWVTDWYLPYPGTEFEHEDFGKIFKIIRGGSWNLEPYYVRSALRSLEYVPNYRSDHIGFRCAITLED